jgi:RNA polymerase sigma factor (sigma-70 family)
MTPTVVAPAAVADPREILTTHIELVRRIVRTVAHRLRLSTSAADELESAVWLRLIEHDYRAIRQYKGEASFGTFLTVIVSRLALDAQAADWGRWRPSSRARRLGNSATLFETLVVRDGYSREEAIAQLEANGHAPPSSEVRALVAKRRSMPRRYIPVELIANTLPGKDDPSEPIVAAECRQRAQEVGRALRDALQTISEEDRSLLRMRHAQGMKVSTIARVLGADQKTLYRKLATLHRRLRRRIAAAGVTSGDVQAVTGRGDVQWPALISGAQSAAA